MSNSHEEELAAAIASDPSRSKKLQQLLDYTKENSKYPLNQKKIAHVFSINSFNRDILKAWLNAEDDCTPRALIKKLFEHARQNNEDETFTVMGRALLRKPIGNSPQELEKAKVKRSKILSKKIGDDKVNRLKIYSAYNKKQIEAWLNFEGEIWSQEDYSVERLFQVLHHVARNNSDFETCKLLNEGYPQLPESMALGRSQLDEIRVKTDKLSPQEINERKQEILNLLPSEEDCIELQKLMDTCFPNQPPIQLWIEGKGEFQHESARTLLTTLFNHVIVDHNRHNEKISLELFNFLVQRRLFLDAPQSLAEYLHSAIKTQNINKTDFVRTLVEMGAPCDVQIDGEYPLCAALRRYYVDPNVFEIILSKGQGVDIYEKEKWGKNALEIAEELAEKHKADSHYNYKKPLEMLREHSKTVSPNKAIPHLHSGSKSTKNNTLASQPKIEIIPSSTSSEEEEVKEPTKLAKSSKSIVSSEEDTNKPVVTLPITENNARGTVYRILFDQISTTSTADPEKEALVQRLNNQWTARGNCPITKADLDTATVTFIEKIVIESTSIEHDTKNPNKFSTAFNIINNEAVSKLNIEELSQNSPEIISTLQNLVAYGIKLNRENIQHPDPALETKIHNLADFIRTIIQQPELTTESIQEAYDKFENDDTNRGTGFYRIYSFFCRKRYDGFHLVKSTAGELAYDLMQALKAKTNTNEPDENSESGSNTFQD